MGAIRFDVRLNESHIPNVYCGNRSIWDLRDVEKLEERDLLGDKCFCGTAVRIRLRDEERTGRNANVHWFLRLWIESLRGEDDLFDPESITFAEWHYVGVPRKGTWQESDLLRWKGRGVLVGPEKPKCYHLGSDKDAMFPTGSRKRRY
ncbi:MAG: hypothetical protein U0136_13835 [Bdellovibrionota bacterium]